MQIKWLSKALKNLQDEAEFIAEDNPQAAQLVVQRVHTAVSQLREQPASGRPGRVHGTRELVVVNTRYIIPYRVRDNTIEVLRVFHTSRKPPRRW
jgi:toxin ParE1/3/4